MLIKTNAIQNGMANEAYNSKARCHPIRLVSKWKICPNAPYRLHLYWTILTQFPCAGLNGFIGLALT